MQEIFMFVPGVLKPEVVGIWDGGGDIDEEQNVIRGDAYSRGERG